MSTKVFLRYYMFLFASNLTPLWVYFSKIFESFLWTIDSNILVKLFKIFLKNSTKFYSFLEKFSIDFPQFFPFLCSNFSFYIFEFWEFQERSVTPFLANLRVFKSRYAINSIAFAVALYSRILNFFFNPPEAIRNLVTPVATPRSVRPGFFNPSGHTTVCQTGVF